MKIDGIHLKTGAVVVVSPYTAETESPKFGQVKEFFLLPTIKMLKIVDYSHHFHAWAVKHTDIKSAVNFRDLCSHQVLHARTSHISFGVVKLITMKYAVF